jgi:hypothetical protein
MPRIRVALAADDVLSGLGENTDFAFAKLPNGRCTLLI